MTKYKFKDMFRVVIFLECHRGDIIVVNKWFKIKNEQWLSKVNNGSNYDSLNILILTMKTTVIKGDYIFWNMSLLIVKSGKMNKNDLSD